MRAVVIIAGVLLLANEADAQAPGETSRIRSVMDRRFAFEVELGALGLHRDVEGADMSDVTFSVGELALRFRVLPAFEIGLSLWGGGAMKGTVGMGGIFVDGRYRFLAERPWNVFASLSLGATKVGSKGPDDVSSRGRGTLRLGVGVERRFRAFAFDAQLRLVGIGENDQIMPANPPTPTEALSIDKLAGGALTLGASYYF